MKNGSLQDPFAEIIVQGSAGLVKEERELGPVLEELPHRLAQDRVWLDLALLELELQPTMKLIHDRAAVLLMEEKPLLGRHLGRSSGIEAIDLAEA